MYKQTLSLPVALFPENVAEISLSSSSSPSDLDTSIELVSKKPQTYPVAGHAYLSQDIAFQEKLCETLYARPRNKSQAKFLFNMIRNFSFIQTLCHETEGSGSIDKTAVMELIKNVKYLRVPQGKIIYKQDEISNNDIYIVFSGEVGILVKKRDLVTRQNLKNLETFRSSRSLNKSSEPTQQKEINPLLVDFIESYVTSHEVGPNQAFKETVPRFLLTIPERDHNSYNMQLRKFSTLIKGYILFMKGLKRRQKIFKAASGYGSVRDRIYRGGYFGELRSFDQKKREETAIALANCEILVVEASMFEEMKRHFYQVRSLIKEFIFESFPKLDEFQSSSVRESLAHALEERRFDLNNKIISEGDTGDYFYVLFSGQCEISKELGIEDIGGLPETSLAPRKSFTRHSSIRKKALLSTISKGVFLGEEILFSPERKYYYSVRVISTKAVILAINVHRFAARFPADVYEGLKEAYFKKESRYLDVIKNLLLSSPYDEFELVEEIQNIKKPITLLTESLLRKPLKLRRKRMGASQQPSLRLDDNLFLNTPNRHPPLSSRSGSSRKEIGGFNIGSIGMFYEPYPEVLNPQPFSFSGIQDLTPSHNFTSNLSNNKFDFSNGLTLQIPRQLSQTEIPQNLAPATAENSLRFKESPRKSVNRSYSKEVSLNMVRTVSQPSEEIPNNFMIPSLATTKTKSNFENIQKNHHYQWKTFRDSSNNTPLSSSSANSQIILKKDDYRRNDNGIDDDWNFMKSLAIKKARIKPSKFQDVKTKKEKEVAKQSVENNQTQPASDARHALKTVQGELCHKHSNSQDLTPRSFRILKLQEKLEKTQRMHLYSRSISYREHSLGEKLKDSPKIMNKISFPKLTQPKKTLEDISPRAESNAFSPKSDRLKGKWTIESLTLGGLTPKQSQNSPRKNIFGDEGLNNEKKNLQGFVKPIVFPLKNKKTRNMHKSIALSGCFQEERIKTLNCGSPRDNIKLVTNEQVYYTTCGSLTKIEDNIPKDGKIQRNAQVDNKETKRMNTASQEVILKQKPQTNRVLKRSELGKGREKISVKKIDVYLE